MTPTMIGKRFNRDRYAVFGRFCAILLGVAMTWTCAAFGLLLVTSSVCGGQGIKFGRDRVRAAEHAIAMYVIDNGKCPRAVDDLVAEKYLARAAAKDPWGTPIVISCSADDWTASSAGPDKRFGTADDIARGY
jgi:hypothetical protein